MFFTFFFWPHSVACGTSLARDDEPALSGVEPWSLNHWTIREVLVGMFSGEKSKGKIAWYSRGK